MLTALEESRVDLTYSVTFFLSFFFLFSDSFSKYLAPTVFQVLNTQ